MDFISITQYFSSTAMDFKNWLGSNIWLSTGWNVVWLYIPQIFDKRKPIKRSLESANNVIYQNHTYTTLNEILSLLSIPFWLSRYDKMRHFSVILSPWYLINFDLFGIKKCGSVYHRSFYFHLKRFNVSFFIYMHTHIFNSYKLGESYYQWVG